MNGGPVSGRRFALPAPFVPRHATHGHNGSHGIQRKTVTAFRGQALSNAQVSRLAKAHTLVDPMHDLPTGTDRTINEAEIAAQNPKGTTSTSPWARWAW